MSVVGHLDVGGQLGVNLGMTTNIVAAVDEPRLTGPYPVGKADSIVECLVTVMGLLTKGIDNKGVTAQNVGQLIIADGLHISDVDEAG